MPRARHRGQVIAALADALALIRDELARIVHERQAHDPNLHYLDGRELYSEADAVEHPLPDNLHPDAATHRTMGERFVERGFTALRAG